MVATGASGREWRRKRLPVSRIGWDIASKVLKGRMRLANNHKNDRLAASAVAESTVDKSSLCVQGQLKLYR